jgi:hypothetical protein
MTRITRGGLMVVAAAMTVTVSACGHVWDSESTGQTTSGARTTPSVLSPTQARHRRGDAHADADLRPALDDVTDRDAADRSLPDCRARATRADSCDDADPDSNDAATERTPAAGDAATR